MQTLSVLEVFTWANLGLRQLKNIPRGWRRSLLAGAGKAALRLKK